MPNPPIEPGAGAGTGAGADQSSPAKEEATSNPTPPGPEPVLTLRLGSLNLTGVGAVIGLIVLLGLLTALLVWIKPTLRMSLSAALWIGFVVYWNAAAKNAAPTVKSESRASRALHQRLLLLSMFVLFVPIPGLRQRLWSSTRLLVAIGLTIQALSILLAAWARRHLGRNWSGAITVASGHQLVRTGPYRLIRHPIYSAILGLFVGTVLVSGQLHALLGLLVVSAAYWRKIRLEERNLVELFGPDYDAYRRESWMLFPGLL
jgi:protein-S-isoprenylcysteine O-methyltransferase Ste14